MSTEPSSGKRHRPSSEKALATLTLRILAKPTELESDPLGRNTTAPGSEPERRRLRVGDYRAVCTIDQGEPVVWIVHVGHPSTVDDT